MRMWVALAFLFGSLSLLSQDQPRWEASPALPAGAKVSGKDLGLPGNLSFQGLSWPVVTIAPPGTTGATYTYAITGTSTSGSKRTVRATTTIGRNTSSLSNVVRVSAWPTTYPFVAPSGSCDVRREVGGTTQGLIGTIANCAQGGTITDKALAGDSSSAPTDTIATGWIGPFALKYLSSPTVTAAPHGTTGSATYTYCFVGIDAGGGTRSVCGSTTTGNATLSAVNYNSATVAAWSSTPPYTLPIGGCRVYRTAGGATQGYIGTTSSCSAGALTNDIGLVADGNSPPSDTSGIGTTIPPTMGGTGTSTAPISAQIPVANSGGTAYVPQSVSGDATLSTIGALTVATVGGNVPPVWAKYSVLAIANGANGCTNGAGCWQVNGARIADKDASPSQDVPLFVWPGYALISQIWAKTSTACAGADTITLTSFGDPTSNTYFAGSLTYDLTAAALATNVLNPVLTGIGGGTTATTGSTYLSATVTVTGSAKTVASITTGCAFDVRVLWAKVQ